MQIEFSAIVQKRVDACETELSSQDVWELFEDTYLKPARAGDTLAYVGHRLLDVEEGQKIELEVELSDGTRRWLSGVGNGPIDATVAALEVPLRIDSYEERNTGSGAAASALAVIEGCWPDIPGSRFGAGLHPNITTASIQAVLSVAARFASVTGGLQLSGSV